VPTMPVRSSAEQFFHPRHLSLLRCRAAFHRPTCSSRDNPNQLRRSHHSRRSTVSIVTVCKSGGERVTLGLRQGGASLPCQPCPLGHSK
jgi:hypothetical protein